MSVKIAEAMANNSSYDGSNWWQSQWENWGARDWESHYYDNDGTPWDHPQPQRQQQDNAGTTWDHAQRQQQDWTQQYHNDGDQGQRHNQDGTQDDQYRNDGGGAFQGQHHDAGGAQSQYYDDPSVRVFDGAEWLAEQREAEEAEASEAQAAQAAQAQAQATEEQAASEAQAQAESEAASEARAQAEAASEAQAAQRQYAASSTTTPPAAGPQSQAQPSATGYGPGLRQQRQEWRPRAGQPDVIFQGDLRQVADEVSENFFHVLQLGSHYSCKVVFQTESAVPCLCLLREEILEDCGASPEAYGSVMYLATRFGKLGRLRASILMQPGMHNKADSISVNVT